jgi:hypothetical protein
MVRLSLVLYDNLTIPGVLMDRWILLVLRSSMFEDEPSLFSYFSLVVFKSNV